MCNNFTWNKERASLSKLEAGGEYFVREAFVFLFQRTAYDTRKFPKSSFAQIFFCVDASCLPFYRIPVWFHIGAQPKSNGK